MENYLKCLTFSFLLFVNAAESSATSLNATGPALYGVNLSGAELGSPGQAYGVGYIYPTSSLNYYSGKGLNLIRLPILWERVQPALLQPLDPNEVARIQSFLQTAASLNQTVLIDIHNYGSYNGNKIGTATVPISAFADLWQRMATTFAGTPGLTGYDLMNEPNGFASASIWPQAAQAGINAVRSVDLISTIFVEGDCYAGAWSWQQCNGSLAPRDPSNNLIFEAHQYLDANSSGTYQGSYDQEGAYPTVGVDRLSPFVNWLQTNGYRGYVGEYGVPGNDPRWLTALSNMLSFMMTNCLSGTDWAGGPWSANYILSVEPANGQDRPQMTVLQNFSNRNCAKNQTSDLSTWGSNRLDYFARQTDGSISHISSSGSAWSAWQSLGGQTLADPSAVSWGAGRIDLVVQGADQSIWHTYGDGSSFATWENLGNQIKGRPAIVSRGLNLLDVLARGVDGALWYRAWNGSAWTNWQSLGGQIIFDPVVIASSANQLDVFVVGTDSALYRNSYNGSTWSGFISLGGTLTATPAVASRSLGQFDIFARGTGNGLWYLPYIGNGITWQALGGVLTSAPSAVALDAQHVSVFVRGIDQSLWSRSLSGSQWSGWQSWGGSFSSMFSVVSATPGQFDIVGVSGTSVIHCASSTFGVCSQNLGGAALPSLGTN